MPVKVLFKNIAIIKHLFINKHFVFIKRKSGAYDVEMNYYNTTFDTMFMEYLVHKFYNTISQVINKKKS